jgi:hypothetical protein
VWVCNPLTLRQELKGGVEGRGPGARPLLLGAGGEATAGVLALSSSLWWLYVQQLGRLRVRCAGHVLSPGLGLSQQLLVAGTYLSMDDYQHRSSHQVCTLTSTLPQVPLAWAGTLSHPWASE